MPSTKKPRKPTDALKNSSDLVPLSLRTESLETLQASLRELRDRAGVYENELKQRRDTKTKELAAAHQRRWQSFLDILKAEPRLVDILCPEHQGDCSDDVSSVCLYTELDEDHTCPRCLLLEMLRENGCTELSVSLDFGLGIVGRFRPDVGF